jgi:hypothetical protein
VLIDIGESLEEEKDTNPDHQELEHIGRIEGCGHCISSIKASG